MIAHIYRCDLCGHDTDPTVSGEGYRLKFLQEVSNGAYAFVPLSDDSASDRVVCRFCIETLAGFYNRCNPPEQRADRSNDWTVPHPEPTDGGPILHGLADRKLDPSEIREETPAEAVARRNEEIPF